MNLARAMMIDNGDLRYRTGSGDPRLSSLLGGSGAGEETQTMFGGAVSATARLAGAYRDVRLAAVAAGQYGQPGSGGGGGGRPGRPVGGDRQVAQ